MTVAISATGPALIGDCGLEDAEALLGLILDQPGVSIDWSHCTSLHTAVVQVILAARVELVGEPPSPFLKSQLAPAIARNRNGLGAGV